MKKKKSWWKSKVKPPSQETQLEREYGKPETQATIDNFSIEVPPQPLTRSHKSLAIRFAKGDTEGWLNPLTIRGDTIYQAGEDKRDIPLARRLPDKIAFSNTSNGDLGELKDSYQGTVEHALRHEGYLVMGMNLRALDAYIYQSGTRRYYNFMIGAAKYEQELAKKHETNAEILEEMMGEEWVTVVGNKKKAREYASKQAAYFEQRLKRLHKFIREHEQKRDILTLRQLQKLPGRMRRATRLPALEAMYPELNFTSEFNTREAQREALDLKPIVAGLLAEADKYIEVLEKMARG